MGQNTTRLGLYLPGGGSTGLITPDEAADIDKINDNMKKIDTETGAFVCTSSTRPSTPYAGKLIYETDTKYFRTWNASTSSWDLVGGTTYPAANLTGSVAIANGGTGATTLAAAQDNLGIGLVPISPTTVEKAGTGSTASANALGKVTFSACTSLSLNGVFSSQYENYRIIFKTLFSADGNAQFRFRKSGTDNTSSVYIQTGIGSSELNTVFGSAQYTNSFQFGYTGTNRRSGIVMDVISPNVADRTQNLAFNTNISADGSYRQTLFKSMHHDSNETFDGFTFYPSTSASMAGFVQVFGYNE